MEILHNESGNRRNAIINVTKWISVCIIFIAFLVIFDPLDKSIRRTVIINSDDAGMCPSVNKGTILALQAGLLKSTSVMVCCPGFEEFARFARANPQFDYGVHLTLTCDLRAAGWTSILPENKVPSLLDTDGMFYSEIHEVGQSVNLSEVELELRAQIHKALDSGIPISHLDHHMFVMYSRPDLLDLYVTLGIEFGLPIRFVRNPPASMLSAYGDSFAKTYAEMVNRLTIAGLPILDQIESTNYSVPPIGKRAYFLNYLRDLSPGVTEIVIHCANPESPGIAPPDAEARYEDASCFSTREFQNEFSRLRIERFDWKQFKHR